MSTLGQYADLRLDYPLTSDSLVLDIGGNLGEFTDAIRERYDCYVRVYEPIPSMYHDLRRKFEGDRKVQVSNHAVTDTCGTCTYYEAGDKGDATNPWVIGRSFQARTLDAMMLPRADLLKMNCEGGEYAILERILEAGHIWDYRFIQVQFHDVVPDAERRMEAIREALGVTHYLDWRRGEWNGGHESWTLR